MALDQATTAFLTSMAEVEGAKPLHEMTPDEARGLGPMLTELSGPGPDVATVEDHSLDTADGHSFRLRVLAPQEPTAVIVYYHGGGWVIGDLDQFDTLGRQLVDKTGAAVVLVEYRKAPENRYPAAVDDSWQALQWVDDHLQDIAGRRVPLIVAGDSAGGNLSAIMAQRARDLSGPRIDLQVLIYPVTDADLDTPSYLEPANQLMLERQTMVWFWDHYADESQRAETDASPLQASDLSGLPPAVVLIAEHDVLRSEGESYAAALAAAGVPVEQRLFPGQMHGFFTMVNILPGSADGLDYVAEQVSHFLAQQPA